MNKRKVQLTGGGTYFVTLPKQWATRMKVGRGAEISLEENATGSLLLVPPTLAGENRVSLSLEDKDPLWIERAIISCYITGFDVIDMNGARITPTQRRAVRQAAQSLVGLEIMDEAKDRIVLHCLVRMRDFAAATSLKRIFAITQAMLCDAVSAFINRDIDLAKDVVERDAEADRLTRVMSRELGLLLRDLLLEKEIGMSRILFHEYHGVAKILERIGDHAGKISRTVPSLTAPLPPSAIAEIDALATAARTAVEESVQAFLNADLIMADRVLSTRDHTPEWEERVRLAKGEENAQPLGTIFDSLLRIRDYAFNIAETALNMGIPGLQEPAEKP